MRKWIVLLLLLTLLPLQTWAEALPPDDQEASVSTPNALAEVDETEENAFTSAEILDFYTASVGRVTFSLPGMTVRYADADMGNMWTNSYQLFGHAQTDNAEFQLRTADIEPQFDYLKKEHPDWTDKEIRLQGLKNYATFWIGYQHGTVGPIHASTERGCTVISFPFNYPDAKGVPYEGKAILDGNRAVALTIQMGEDGRAALDRMAVMAEDDAQQRQVRDVDLRHVGISSLLPKDFTYEGKSGADRFFCMDEDLTQIVLGRSPILLQLNGTDDENLNMMTDLAEKALPVVEGNRVIDPVLYRRGMLTQLDFTTVSAEPLGEEVGEHWLCRVCLNNGGIWYIFAADTETGRAFMQATVMDVGVNLFSVDSSDAAADQQEAAVYADFLKRFAALAHENPYGLALDVQQTYASEAFYAAGCWRRIIRCGESMHLSLDLTDSSENAQIQELRVVSMTAAGEDPAPLLLCAAEALTSQAAKAETLLPLSKDGAFWGSYRLTQDAIEKEGFDRFCDLYRFRAEQELTMQHETTEPAAEELPPIIATVHTDVDTMMNRMRRIHQQFGNESAADKHTVSEFLGVDSDNEWVVVDDGTGDVLYALTDGMEEDAPIQRLKIKNMSQNPPVVLLSTIAALAAVSDMPADQMAAMMALVQEYPLWSDLEPLYPLFSWNGVVAYLTDAGTEDEPIPTGMLCGVAEAAP